jgi:hypothetical protein
MCVIHIYVCKGERDSGVGGEIDSACEFEGRGGLSGVRGGGDLHRQMETVMDTHMRRMDQLMGALMGGRGGGWGGVAGGGWGFEGREHRAPPTPDEEGGEREGSGGGWGRWRLFGNLRGAGWGGGGHGSFPETRFEGRGEEI